MLVLASQVHCAGFGEGQLGAMASCAMPDDVRATLAAHLEAPADPPVRV